MVRFPMSADVIIWRHVVRLLISACFAHSARSGFTSELHSRAVHICALNKIWLQFCPDVFMCTAVVLSFDSEMECKSPLSYDLRLTFYSVSACFSVKYPRPGSPLAHPHQVRCLRHHACSGSAQDRGRVRHQLGLVAICPDAYHGNPKLLFCPCEARSLCCQLNVSVTQYRVISPLLNLLHLLLRQRRCTLDFPPSISIRHN